MLVSGNKDAGSEILEGIGPPTQGGRGGRGPNALKYQNPIVISTHKEMLSIQELHLEHLNLSSAMQFPKAALCRARKEIFDPRIELLIIFFVAICI